jgi:hypothetical protein
METSCQDIAVLFIDICGSTKLFDEVGDHRALSLTSACLAQMEGFITKEGGTALETRGDGILCTFSRVDAALQAAQSIREGNQSSPLSVHAGLHYGPTISCAGSIYGDVVNVAARMVDLAKDDEIIISEDAFQRLSKSNRASIRALGRVAVKGKDHLMRIYLSAYQALDQTILRGSFESTIGSANSLNLIYHDRVYQVKAPASSMVLGRHRDCGLIVRHNYVSRRHATIECKRGKFFLNDHSSNGSYVSDKKKQLSFLRRDMLQLRDNGLISLGIEPNQNSDHIIKYALISNSAPM